ncbi:Protein ZINC INDUCED FACILITATOR-LIKE 1 [Zea mays]|uniref:Protein ZINC INDUCED FACILITATOR-LIKE 1 n=1 Tax=Zea mays TaxID=4577 RepID=A0A3L6FJ02_MAIZE|nr:Protein ZINC INDUCED FACILITATOR-LIKE 1 [Zea mays]
MNCYGSWTEQARSLSARSNIYIGNLFYLSSTAGPITVPLSILHGATYFLGRAISAVPWGMFADKNGRKPGIVISILSVIVFNTLFGLSTTYWMAIVTRGLLGLLCGILGPIKVTSSRAIALVIGPAIGGFLAQVKIMEFR